MVKKTIFAVVAVVLLVAVFAGAANRWGYTRYGAIYNTGTPYYTYYPVFHDYPVESMYYPYGYDTYSPYLYDAWYPKSATVNYPYAPQAEQSKYSPSEYETMSIPRSAEGQLCGVLNSRQYGCQFGLVCDYTRTGTTGVGVCTSQPPHITNYPNQFGYPSTNYPYY